ncbi:aldehyde dehydrogenase [Aaosphaeria arxii CBS 175.79]|uniref:Aldehyde dehydrogenase n=1 Tax=Aaosphaeria arxii CBS 175.79 TaxID=1450172 RepID=A0A6A5XCG5_9PLEO|nr:aldehyde dehydrogenase [Aaosphaeria arxii CBS 175.79]KAF2010795.1 aldehyde dehydrogenase [Aaosphaeria arxii CBS 175.79]
MAQLPPFEHTSIDAIPSITAGIRASFLSHKTRPLEFRIQQLRKLYWGLKDNSELIAEACKKDIGKSSFEAYLTEISWTMNDCIFMSKNVTKWAQDEKPEDIALTNKFFGPRIRKDPMGTVLVIGAYNFPVQLSVGPVIGAIAAGCTAVLKPSEQAPHTAAVLQKVFAESLDPSCYTVIQGGVPETTALLDQKWDKIFYTGSANVGTIIAKKAAETLTPVTLELGGRNPAIVTKQADPRLAARRLLWAKTLNAGQVCLSQNFTLVDKDIVQDFIRELKTALKEFYPQGVKKSPDYGRIVNQRQFQRLKKMVDDSNGKIVIGGEMDESELFIEPTVVLVDSTEDSMLKDESFGPLLPILPVTDLDEAIKIANEVHDTPLGVYPFGSKEEVAKVISQTRSGGASMNDGFFHASIPTMPFGGVGTSGTGAYRGKSSFETFTHRRSITTTPAWIEGMLDIRYPPYTLAKQNKFSKMNGLKPDFDREGRSLGWASWFLGLIGLKSLTAVVIAVGIRFYLQRRAKL